MHFVILKHKITKKKKAKKKKSMKMSELQSSWTLKMAEVQEVSCILQLS